MTAEVFLERFRENWHQIAWWCLGIAAFTGITLVFYPSIRDSSGLASYSQQLPEAMRSLFVGGELDLTSPSGYLNSQIFALLGPVILVVFAIGAGSSAVAGEEERGLLDLGLAQPVSRTSVVIQEFFWLSAGVAILTTCLLASVVLASIPFDLNIGFGHVLAVTVSTGLFGLVFGSLALAVGCLAPGRNKAIAVAAAAATISWMFDGLANSVAWLEPFRVLSPYHQAFGGGPLVNGPPWEGWLVLVAAILILAGASVAGLGRRDVRH